MPAQTLHYTCPHCGQPMELDAHDAGSVVNCTNAECGKPFLPHVPSTEPEQELVFPPGVQVEQPKPPVAQHAPEAEPILATVRPVMFRRYPLRYLGYSVLVVLGVVALVVSAFTGSVLLAVTGAVVAALGGYRLGVWWARNRSTEVQLTGRRVILRQGVTSPDSIEVLHENIVALRVRQNLLNRLLHTGDVVVASGGEQRREIVLLALPDPEQFAEQVRGQVTPT